jgi:RNA polymerase sigma-70 factor (ECF subfamily)
MSVSVSSVEKYIATGIKECKRSLWAQGYDSEDQPVPDPYAVRRHKSGGGAE